MMIVEGVYNSRLLFNVYYSNPAPSFLNEMIHPEI